MRTGRPSAVWPLDEGTRARSPLEPRGRAPDPKRPDIEDAIQNETLLQAQGLAYPYTTSMGYLQFIEARKKKFLASAPAGLSPPSGRMQPGRPDTRTRTSPRPRPRAGMLSPPTRGGGQDRRGQVQRSQVFGTTQPARAPPGTRFWHPGKPSQSPARLRTEPIYIIYTQNRIFRRASRACM